MSADDDFDESLDDGTEYEFEVFNSEDGLFVTLTCFSTKELAPDEYAQALRAFADRIESIVTMSEVSGQIH